MFNDNPMNSSRRIPDKPNIKLYPFDSVDVHLKKKLRSIVNFKSQVVNF